MLAVLWYLWDNGIVSLSLSQHGWMLWSIQGFWASDCHEWQLLHPVWLYMCKLITVLHEMGLTLYVIYQSQEPKRRDSWNIIIFLYRFELIWMTKKNVHHYKYLKIRFTILYFMAKYDLQSNDIYAGYKGKIPCQRPNPRAETWHKIWMTGLNPNYDTIPIPYLQNSQNKCKISLFTYDRHRHLILLFLPVHTLPTLNACTCC